MYNIIWYYDDICQIIQIYHVFYICQQTRYIDLMLF